LRRKIAITFILVILILAYLIFSALFLKLDIQDQIIRVSPGDSFKSISSELKERNIITFPFFINLYADFSYKAKQIKTGEYEIKANDTIFAFIEDMIEGNNYYREFRIQEGISFFELILELKSNKYLKDDLGGNPESFLSKNLDIRHLNLEGLFAPETYFYKSGDLLSELLERAYRIQEKNLNDAWFSRSLNIPYQDKYDLLILASIIEKEGPEKLKIAGVFLRRLKLGMKLQTDPTVIYAMGRNYHGNIRKKDLLMKHPYNTYYIKGLPPGPISMPNKSSIIAASQLDNETALFFVSKGDGTHYFSDTYEEHRRAVIEYQLKNEG